MGKGDKPRPLSISRTEYYKKYEAAFGKQKTWWSTQEHQDNVEKMRREKEELSRKIDGPSR